MPVKTGIQASLHARHQYLYLAAKYLRKTFARFDEAMGIVLDGQTSFEILCEGLDALAEAQSKHKAGTSDEKTVE